MNPFKKLTLFICSYLLFSLGLFVQPIKAQLDSLQPVWKKTWQGLTGFGSLPCNAWDVHVYGDMVYTTGLKTDKALPIIAPMVLKAYTLDGDLVWERTWEGYQGVYAKGASGAVLLGHAGALYLGGSVSYDSMNASLLQKWDLNGNLIWTQHWGDKTNNGHHEVNGLAIVGNQLYVSHYSGSDGFVTIDAHIKKFDLCALNAGDSWSGCTALGRGIRDTRFTDDDRRPYLCESIRCLRLRANRLRAGIRAI